MTELKLAMPVLPKQCACGAMTDQKSGRCRECGNMAVRMSRVLANKSDEFKFAFESGRHAIDKTEFANKCKGLFGDDLVAVMESVVNNTYVREQEVQCVGTGEYFDEVEMKEKYKNNPVRLAALLKQDPFECPKTGIPLYEDMRFKRTFSDSSKTTQTQQMQLNMEDKIKRKAKAKPKPEAKSEQGGEPVELNERQLDAMDTLKESVEKSVVAINEKLTAIKDHEKLLAMVPGYVMTNNTALALKSEAYVEQLKMAAESKTCLDVKALLAEGKKLVSSMKEGKKQLALQADEANKVLSAEAA